MLINDEGFVFVYGCEEFVYGSLEVMLINDEGFVYGCSLEVMLINDEGFVCVR